MLIRAALAGMLASGAVLAGAAPVLAHPADPHTGNDPAAVRDFLDKQLPKQLSKYRIPGAAAVVIEDGKRVAIRGYGVADVAQHTPVDPKRTGFFMGSVAKVFTSTAVLQQVKAGRLDLHTDVNRYLTGFTIADTYPGHPVTLANLLTHTSGFADKVLGAGGEPAQHQSLGQYLADHQPDRVRPPGKLAAYDNYGVALAGYLVQRVSGEPFDRYVQRHILDRLGMSHTTFRQPHPAALDATAAHGYRPTADGQRVERGQYGAISPTGAGAFTTAADMSRFMRAQLGLGSTVLPDKWRTKLQSRHFGPDSRLPGMAYLWEQRDRDGQRVLGKGGDVPGFHDNLALLPDSDSGIYVVYNGDGRNGLATFAGHDLTQRFIDRFHDGHAPRPAVRHDDVSDLAGSYRTTRLSTSDFTRSIALVSGVTVTADGPGRLSTTGLSLDPKRQTQHWQQIGTGLFVERGGQDRIAFTADGALLSGADPTQAFQKVPFYATPTVILTVLVLALLLLLTGLIGWPLAALVRRLRHRPGPRGSRAARWVTAGTGLALLAFLVGLVSLVGDGNALNEMVLLGGNPLLVVVLGLASVAASGALATAVLAVVAWVRRWWSTPSRVHYSLVAVFGLAFSLIAAQYQLLLQPLPF